MRRLGFFLGGLLAVGGLTPPGHAAGARSLLVVTSFLPAYCFTVNVAGDRARVENLLPPGVVPHDYALSPGDLRRLAAADLIVVNGLGMESWLKKAFRAGGQPSSGLVVEAAGGLGSKLIYGSPSATAGAGLFAPARAAAPNPHFWLDPTLAARAVTNILRALQKADPPNAVDYARNAARYVERLERLDDDLHRGLAPLRTRGFVTLHNAFPYFVRRYELNLIGVIEVVPEMEPSAKHLSELLHRMRERQAKAIFTEPLASPRLVRQLGRDLHLPVGEMDPLETGPLTASAYEDGMRRNLEVLRRCLE